MPRPLGLRPDASVGVRPLTRRQASLETNLCRKGIWHVGPLQLALPIDGSDTLGLLRVAGPPLTLFDLDMVAWLTERWREGTRDPTGRVDFTLYELGQDLYGRKPGGDQRRDMRASVARLYKADFELEGYRADAAVMGRLGHPTESGWVRLVAAVRWSTHPVSEHHRIYLGPFIVEQLRAGHLTYLDWRILRALDGLAKRLWVYLESQTFKRSDIGEGAVSLHLAPPLLHALGVTTRHAPHARRLLLRAGERISAADRSFVGFDLRKPGRHGGTWALIARRRLAARSLPRSPDRGRATTHDAHAHSSAGARMSR